MDERVAASPRDRGHGAARKIHERNFYRRADILTLLSRAKRIGGECGRYFTTESRATSIVLPRKRLFAPRSELRAVVPFAVVITTRNESTRFVRIPRTEAAEAADYGLARATAYCIAASSIIDVPSGLRRPGIADRLIFN